MTTGGLRVPGRRWRIAWLLGLGVMVNYVDRVNLSVSQSALHADFGISVITFGYLSSAYNWTYALLQLPVGVWIDRLGVRRVGRASILIWSLASFWAAMAQGVRGFFAARLLLGVGEAPTFPSNAKAIAAWFPEGERGLPTAIFDASAKFAPALGVPLLGVLMVHFGWRLSFVATGALSLLYFAAFYAVYRDPVEDAALSAEEREYIGRGRAEVEEVAGESGASLGDLLRTKKVLGMALGMGAYNYSFYLLLAWLPSFFSSMPHVDLLHSALYTAIPWIFATAVDVLVGGVMVDHLIRRGWDANRVRRSVLIGGTVCGLGLVGAAMGVSLAAAIFWISLSLGGLSVASPVLWSVPGLIVPRASVGKVGGIANFWGQFSGAISAPIITGYTISRTHGYALAFWLAGAYLLVGIAAYVFLLGRIGRER